MRMASTIKPYMEIKHDCCLGLYADLGSGCDLGLSLQSMCAPGPTLVSANQYSAAGVSFLLVLCLEEVMQWINF